MRVSLKSFFSQQKAIKLMKLKNMCSILKKSKTDFVPWIVFHSDLANVYLLIMYIGTGFSRNVSTTPIMAMGCWQCLPLIAVQLKGKHCQKPHCRNGVVDTFRQTFQRSLWQEKQHTMSYPVIRPQKTFFSKTHPQAIVTRQKVIIMYLCGVIPTTRQCNVTFLLITNTKYVQHSNQSQG